MSNESTISPQAQAVDILSSVGSLSITLHQFREFPILREQSMKLVATGNLWKLGSSESGNSEHSQMLQGEIALDTNLLPNFDFPFVRLTVRYIPCFKYMY